MPRLDSLLDLDDLVLVRAIPPLPKDGTTESLGTVRLWLLPPPPRTSLSALIRGFLPEGLGFDEISADGGGGRGLADEVEASRTTRFSASPIPALIVLSLSICLKNSPKSTRDSGFEW